MLTITVSPAGRGKFIAHLRRSPTLQCNDASARFYGRRVNSLSEGSGSQRQDHNAPRWQRAPIALTEHNRYGCEALRSERQAAGPALRAL